MDICIAKDCTNETDTLVCEEHKGHMILDED